MRAARLLQILLLLQNRGRQTSVQLAQELEVAPRTILRDVDAMTEAGLPIIVFQGPSGGIELGFNYRTRLTGLSRDEATALGLILAAKTPTISVLGLDAAAQRARAKLIESLPDKSRHQAKAAQIRFEENRSEETHDKRARAMARAVLSKSIVRIRFATSSEQTIHPVKLSLEDGAWTVEDGLTGDSVHIDDWGRLNISAKCFATTGN